MTVLISYDLDIGQAEFKAEMILLNYGYQRGQRDLPYSTCWSKFTSPSGTVTEDAATKEALADVQKALASVRTKHGLTPKLERIAVVAFNATQTNFINA